MERRREIRKIELSSLDDKNVVEKDERKGKHENCADFRD